MGESFQNFYVKVLRFEVTRGWLCRVVLRERARACAFERTKAYSSMREKVLNSQGFYKLNFCFKKLG